MGPRRRAFTLAELMIVIAIIGILLALLVPGFGEAWALANQTRCTDNLHRLYQAVSMRNADEMVNVRLTSLRATVWPAQLMPYLERGAEIMVCPNGGESLSGGGGSGGGTGGSTIPGGGDGGSDDGGPLPLGPPPNYAQLTDLAEVKNVLPDGTRYFAALDEGPWMLKLSETQYNAAIAQNLLNNTANADSIRTKFNCNYSPGGNPYSYWLCNEDHGGDDDYKDLMIHVTEESDGSFTLDMNSGTTNRKNYIVSKPDGVELLLIPQNQTGLHLTLRAVDEGVPTGGSDGSGGPGGTGGQRPGEQDVIPNVIVATSYAMNERYPRMPRKGGKILLMDYCHYLAYVTDDWSGEDMDPDADGIPVFARHWSRMNVLYADGSVRLEDASDVNPAIPTTEMLLWAP